MIIAIIGGIVFIGLLGLVSIFFYKRSKAYKKRIERSLKMVPLKIRIPRESGSKDMQGRTRDDREAAQEIISYMETFYANLSATYKKGIKNVPKNFLYGQRYLTLEIIASGKEIFFYIATPVTLVDMVEKMLSSQYPDTVIEKVEEHNIFSKEWKKMGIAGGELSLKRSFIYPIKTYKKIDAEPLEAVTTSLSKLDKDEGAAIQVLIRPVSGKVMSKARGSVKKSQNQRKGIFGQITESIFSSRDKIPETPEPIRLTAMEEEINKEMEQKAGKASFDTLIRFIVSTSEMHRSEMILSEMQSAFAQFNDHNLNSFKFRKAKSIDRLVTDYIFRFFPDNVLPFNIGFKKRNILNTEELASIYHLPNYLISSPGIKWLPAKVVETPVDLPQEGTMLGTTTFRGEKKTVYLSEDDKRRHVYILGQTGTGKTTLMLNMIIDDITHGKGVAYIDPHGDAIGEIINKIPKERAEDVVIFDASDLERPMGLNVFEGETIEQKDLLTNETLQILYQLYDPQMTGQIFGPRFDHWFRNAALTLMADPRGGTLIEIPTLFTNKAFLSEKLKYVTDPVIRSFWLDEVANTPQKEVGELLSYIIPKFGAFMTNTTMRNIIGQSESTLNLREIMDSNKILLINLSKGRIGEVNMRLLGMILVLKLQVAAMSRADVPEADRKDFTLYVDEFQNFITQTFADILSEARKYRFILVVANQFIGQLSDEIRAAVFGNVGTMMSFRVGPEDGEYMAKQFEPVFSVNDLIGIENGYTFTRLMIKGYPSRPFIIHPTWPPIGTEDKKVGDAIRQLARLKYTREKSIIEKEIVERMPKNTLNSPQNTPPDRP